MVQFKRNHIGENKLRTLRVNKIKLKPKNLRTSTPKLVLASIVLIILIFVGLLIVIDKSRTNHPSETTGRYVDGSGGNPKLVVSYHDQAVAAWKAGNKRKAKDLANKGLQADYQLTSAQQSEVPNQMGKLFDLNDIVKGVYLGYEQ